MRRPFLRVVPRLLAAVLAALVLGVHAVHAIEQEVSLRAGWNLMALNVEPPSTEPVAVFAEVILAGKLEAVWSYDAETGQWARFPSISNVPALDTIEPGLGYWVKVTQSFNFVVQGVDGALPRGTESLAAGWNLVGFVFDGPVEYDRVLHDLPIRQIWSFDANARRFRGVILSADPATPPPLEDFAVLEPGQGYWILSGEDASLAPQLATALPGDIDVAPLLPEALPGVRQPFDMSNLSPGDRDIGEDGFYDRSESQRSVDFGDFSNLTTMTIFNRGGGVLSWSAEVLDPGADSWLRFRIRGEIPSEDQFLAELDGTVTTDNAEIDLFVDRTSLAPGTYDAQIRIDSNAADGTFPAEPSRTIDLTMQVPELDGDYRVKATIKTINGQPADTHNPRFHLSLYRDSDGLKGIFDGTRSLLIPDYCVGGGSAGASCGSNAECGTGRCEHYVRLAGRVYQSDSNKFTVTASFELPVGATDNPYQVPLRRDITLIGDRPTHADPLGPQDLKGEYRETIRNVLGLPIYLSGTFEAERLSPDPSARDTAPPEDGNTVGVPDDSSVLERTLNVSDNLLLSEVDVQVNIVHSRPSDLRVEVRGPDGTTVILRDHSGDPAGDLVYADTATPAQSLGTFVGKGSQGMWKLRVVDDVIGQTGTLVKWGLRLQGTRVNGISGTISGVGAGAKVLLSGCGLVRSTTTNAGGQYSFANLIDCVYSITVQHSGFTRERLTVALQGADRTGQNLAPTTAPADQPIEVVLPADPTEPLKRITSMTVGAGAGALLPDGKLQYAFDSATYDIDRPPYANPGGPGLEDSNAFVPVVNALTGSNLLGINNQIDGPVCANQPINPTCSGTAKHAFVAIGGAAVGMSVNADQRLAIGANP